ncbi:MAG: hypothetical protein JKX81_05165 [Arenicella sp.]|nr:hypothetical protein [Arenicella sp.]
MNYLCSYWLSADASDARVAELKRYFDLQCYLKRRMGSHQIILTNIDYPGATPIDLPLNFTTEFAMFTRYFGLAQVVKSGISFPLCVHDHDFFNGKELASDDSAILVGALVNDFFSDQVVVYPEISKQAILDFVDSLWALDFDAFIQSGYGTEVRHEGLFSTEQTMANLGLHPFESIPIRREFNVKDQVSFDIIDQHSLDPAYVEAQAIPASSHGAHGHLNKGPATNVLLDWLASNLT